MNKQHLFACSDISPIAVANQRNGIGTILLRTMLGKAVEDSVFSAISVITLPPGTSIGVHIHENNEEAYVIIAGEALYTYEEGEHVMKAGDIALCYKGEKHGIFNNGTTDCIMAGIVVQK